MLARVLVVQSPCPRGLRARPHSSKLTLSRFAECRCCSFVLCTFPRCHCFRFHFRENHAVGSTIYFSYALPVLSAAGQRERSETFSLGHFTLHQRNGGHRDSRLNEIAPCNFLTSPEQRVRYIPKRNASYRRSGNNIHIHSFFIHSVRVWCAIGFLTNFKRLCHKTWRYCLK